MSDEYSLGNNFQTGKIDADTYRQKMTRIIGTAASWYTRPNRDGSWFWRAYVGADARMGVASSERIARQEARLAFTQLREACP